MAKFSVGKKAILLKIMELLPKCALYFVCLYTHRYSRSHNPIRHRTDYSQEHYIFIYIYFSRFQTITNAYYRGTGAVILVFDVTNRTTFDSVENWLKAINSHCPENVAVVLVGTNIDLTDKRTVTHDEAEGFAKKNGIDYVETSSKSNSTVSVPFERLLEKFLSVNDTSDSVNDTNNSWWMKHSSKSS